MLYVIEYVLGAIITSYINIYISSKILEHKIKWKIKKPYIAIFVYTLILILTYSSSQDFFKVIINYFGLVACNQIIFKEKLNKIAVATLATFTIIAFSEIFYTMIIVGLFGVSIVDLKDAYFVSLISNIGIAYIGIFIISIPPLKKLIIEKIGNMNSKSYKPTLILSILTVIFLALVLYYIHFTTDLINALITSMTLILIFLFIIFKLFNESNENIKIQAQCDTVIHNLKDYEKMLTIQYMRNHENKNNLISIRGLINKNDKKALAFIDTLMEERQADNYNLLNKTKSIPGGGLQGLIYQKVLTMQNKDIRISLETSKELLDIDFEWMQARTSKDICTIIGVFIDNAIQAVENYESRMVGIHIYVDGQYLIITISNNYEGILNIDHFDDNGYTTKEKGHGYGLGLVKEIINRSNSNIINERTINGNIFSQILKIHIKKR